MTNKFIEQRVEALENELSELKLIVAQIRKPSTVVEEALANDIIEFEGKQYKKVEDKPNFNNYKPMRYIGKIETAKPKTANQLRAEIIEKAKAFVEFDSKVDLTFNRGKGYVVGVVICDVEFVVNEEKRTVVALLRWKFNNQIQAKGIAKCDPSDVFNEHIGKAIALGRALGLDVSEFEQAVQPSLAVGQECVIKNWEGHNGKTLTITKVFDNGKKANHNYKYGYLEDCHLTIINDTNAIYETAVSE